MFALVKALASNNTEKARARVLIATGETQEVPRVGFESAMANARADSETDFYKDTVSLEIRIRY